MKNQIVFLMLILISASVFAQQMMGPPAGDYVFKGEDGVIEIPFQLIQNHVILTADLNGGNSVKLVLDTGMPAHGAMLYKTKQIEDLNLKFSGQAMVGGAGGELKPADILMGASLSFPGLEFNGIDIVILPHDEISRRVFTSHDGVIGYSFFSRFVMEFDFEKMILKVIEPDKFDSTGKGTEIPIEIVHNSPFITCYPTLQDGTRKTVKMILDMGGTHAVSLDSNEDEKIVPPSKTLIRKAAGVGGEFDVIQGRIKSFEIGNYKLNNVIASFSDLAMGKMQGSRSNSNLGMEILTRFNFTIDYKGTRIFLKPNIHFDRAFETNMSGIRYYRDENENLVVEAIIDDSPAFEIGLRATDIITKIDGKTSAEIDTNDLIEIFQHEGKTLELTIKRDGIEIMKKLKLRRLI
ncbi:MAG: hypothetical protein DRI23_11840 [Candidatus Cloacimonadota bacterium]|nr:MAG: hypothetical protein DRI23_11840 [Candidatus Cloacimonadota bacterium]